MARPTDALIVDDEAHVRAFLRLLLREVGITTCLEAGDGLTAVSMVQQHNPGLVLLDINLPQLNGLEVLAKLRALGLDVPVIMVTSQSAISAVNEAVRLGASGYLLKHIPKEQAVAALKEVLDSLEEDADSEG
jgi:DNA-binding NarL/FixJ family response regulator